ncbi:hypothetical protein MTO96_045332 [Rhipicephalus appendiculatus]
MDATNAGGSIGKRTREEATNDGTKTDAMNSEEPPPKTAGMRRLSIRPPPNIPPDKRPAETVPNWTERLPLAKVLGREPSSANQYRRIGVDSGSPRKVRCGLLLV